jgi:hypothetical protein
VDEITLQDAWAQAARRALETEDPQAQVSLWRELAHTYDNTVAWWPRQAPGFRRLIRLRDWAHQLGIPARGQAQKTSLRAP